MHLKNLGMTFEILKISGLINITTSEKLFSSLKHFSMDENHEYHKFVKVLLIRCKHSNTFNITIL